MVTKYQKFAMSKPVGRVLDSKMGKMGAKMGSKIIKGAKKAGKMALAPAKWAGNQIEKEAKMNKAKDDKYRSEAPYGAYGTPSYNSKPLPVKSSGKSLGSFKKGGKVKKTGKYKLHKGEVVVPVKKVKKMKVMKSANPGDLFNKFAKKKK